MKQQEIWNTCRPLAFFYRDMIGLPGTWEITNEKQNRKTFTNHCQYRFIFFTQLFNF